MNRTRTVLLAIVILALTALAGALAPQTKPAGPKKKAAGAARTAPGTVAGADARWKEIETLAAEQKVRAALERVEALRDDAARTGDETNRIAAELRAAQLRGALHSPETALRGLLDVRRPVDPLLRAALELYTAQALSGYAHAYSWEINSRERVEGSADLRAWTREQIYEAAQRAFLDAWRLRARLGEERVEALERFLVPNDYPREIRGTLRDAVSYLFVALLADSSLWTPAEQNDTWRLSARELVDPERGGERAPRLTQPGTHPLVRLAAVLDDLEAWHRAAGRRGAELEARLERARRLHTTLEDVEQRAAVRLHLAEILPPYRDDDWHAVGLVTLAELTRDGDPAPDARIRALALARDAQQQHPGSIGAQRARSVAAAIEAPEYALEGMRADGPGRRSLRVSHRNLARLHFRAWRFDLERTATGARDYNLLPNYVEMNKALERAPEAQWSSDLPATPDYRDHFTFVTPKLGKTGLWIVAASVRADFAKEHNRIQALPIVVGDLVIVTRQIVGALEAAAVTGAGGEPVAGAQVDLYRYDWQKGHQRVRRATTGADGVARFTAPEDPKRNQWEAHFVLARHGEDLAIDPSYRYVTLDPPAREQTASLVYTDRTVYRPRQTLRWKTLVYSGNRQAGRFRLQPQASVTVTLKDGNGDEVETRTVSTNAFGSAAGEFQLPAGRLLGWWRLETSHGGSAQVRVEEYKRPTFEVTIDDPREALRLNRPAALAGTTRYYFGLPVTEGRVAWRVVREPQYPWWWWHRGATGAQSQTVAAGSAALDAEGKFRFTFTPEANEREAREEELTYRFSVTAEITDAGGETREASRVFRLGPAAIEAIVTSESGFLRAGESAELSVRRADLDGVGRAGEGTWRIETLRQPERTLLPAEQPPARPRASVKLHTETPGDRLRPRWETQIAPLAILHNWPAERVVGRGTLTHDAEGRATLALAPLAAGVYRVTYETTDAFGEKATATRDLVVAAASGNDVRLPLLLLAEKSSLSPPVTARFLALSGIAGQRLVLDVYRGGRLRERRELRGGKGAEILEIPVGEAERGGFGVTLTAVADHQLMTQSESLMVPWDDRELAVELTTFRDTLRPGARESWRVTVRPKKGGDAAPVAAELLAYMYDRSLDLFAPHSPAAPLSLYPHWTGVAPVDSSLGRAQMAHLLDHDLAQIPGAPSLIGDRLRTEDGYGIGGPGGRGLYAMSLIDGREEGMARGAAGGARVAQEVSPAAPQSRSRNNREMDAVAKKSDVRQDANASSVADAAGATPQLRSDFSETAFWVPQLLTGADGAATLEFTVPDSVTAWNVWVHAVTADLRAGSLRKEARTVKELMVRPYLPRFLREGDAAEIRVVVNNASDAPATGSVKLEFLDTANEKSRAAEFGLAAADAERAFTAPARGSATVRFSVKAPRRLGDVAVRVTATAGRNGDGELRPLPVLPARVRLAQSRFAALQGAGAHRTLDFPDMRAADPTRVDEQLVVTVDAQLFEGMLAALPYLVDYPYECTEQTLNRYLGAAIVTGLGEKYPPLARLAADLAKRATQWEAWDENDPNRSLGLEETPWLAVSRGGSADPDKVARILEPRVAKARRDVALAKLREAQTAIGGFPWWSGGPPSPYMTLYLLHGFAKGSEFGVEPPRDVATRAFQYLHRHYLDEIAREMLKRECCVEEVTFLNYVLSSYPEEVWKAGGFTAAERAAMLEHSLKYWQKHSPYLKGYLTLTLARAGKRADAQRVWDSVMDSARTDADLGTYWAPEERSWLWYNDTIETHAFALRVLSELDPDDARGAGLVQWLFLNKQLDHWRSTRATAEVLYATAHWLSRKGELGIAQEALVAIGPRSTRLQWAADRYTGTQRVVLREREIDPATASRIEVSTPTRGTVFASATWHFTTEKLPAADRGDLFAVSRRFFRRERIGTEVRLTPLAPGTALAVGDEVEVQVSLTARHTAEYVHLRDPRPAGLEPGTAGSRWRWDLGIAAYEEVRDSATNFFIERLPAGEYTLVYRLRAATAGEFRAAPATLQSMYAPEFTAYSAGGTITVR